MKILIIYFLLIGFINNINAKSFYNSYPTLAIIEYANTCMASNSGLLTALKSCACSIDIIASEIPYDKYVTLETIMRMQQIPGEKTLAFKTASFRKEIDVLYNAQIRANKICFTNVITPEIGIINKFGSK